MKISFFESDSALESIMATAFVGHELFFYPYPIQEHGVVDTSDIISVFVHSQVSKKILDSFPQVTCIATRSTGFDHIDMLACTQRTITVTTVPTYGERTVAEYTFALLLSLSRKLRLADLSAEQLHKRDYHDLTGFDLYQKRLGIIGTGRIGCHVAEIAKGFGMHVYAYDLFPKPSLQTDGLLKYVELNELLSEADIITLHVPYSEATHHCINQAAIDRMKPGVIF